MAYPPQSQPAEQPLYVLAQNKKRLLLPKIAGFMVLGVIFYLGILLNISLLNLSAASETWVKLVSLVILAAIIVLGVFLNLKRSGQKYLFYANRIVFGKKQASLAGVAEVKVKQNLFDKLFKTYSLLLDKSFRIDNIPAAVSLQPYVQNLVAYAKNRPAI